MNSRATGRRIHELLKRFGRKERGRGYRVVTSSKKTSLDPAPGALLSHMEQSFRPILTKSSPQPDEGIECSTSCARPPLSAVHSRESEKHRACPRIGYDPKLGNPTSHPIQLFPGGPSRRTRTDSGRWPSDQVSPRPTISVLDDERFRLFNPHHRSDLLSPDVYNSSYGALIKIIAESISAANGDE
jgi:hypothetical protein